MIFSASWDPWDASARAGAEPYPGVPDWADCLRCGEQFAAGDAGVVMPYLGQDLDARYLVGFFGATCRLVAEHRECQLAGVAGHLVGVCSCTGWDPAARATAVEVQRRVDAGALLEVDTGT